MPMACWKNLLIFVWMFAVSGAIQTAYGQAPQSTSTSGNHLLLVVGAAGEESYGSEFQQWAERWLELAKRQDWQTTTIGMAGHDETDADNALTQLRQAIEAHQQSPERLWLVMLGHGTFARNTGKFNLVGPDVSAGELKQWLATVSAPVIVVNCSSSSAPFLTELAGKNRILLTATRSGNEMNYARFGKYLSLAISDLASDIDHDQEVSLLEAFLAASANTERFYQEESRLATEHALLDDNGDRTGTSADFYRGLQPNKKVADDKPIDGQSARKIILYSSSAAIQLNAEQQQQRQQIESAIENLRLQKNQLPSKDYYDQLEQLLLEMARIYDAATAQSL